MPPREFVRARDALAADLEKKGKSAEAREVRRLRRPSPVIWALNNAAARRPEAVAELADAVDRLRRAQLGTGDLRPATERYRATIEALVREAVARLREAGSPTSTAVERRLQSTLLAASADRCLRASLMAGRLSEEREAPGFDVLTQGSIPKAFIRARPPAGVTDRPPRAGQSVPPKQAAPRLAQPPSAPSRGPEAAAGAGRKAARQARREATALDRAARRKEQAAEAAVRRVATMQKALMEHTRRAEVLRAAATEARRAATAALARAQAR